MTAHALGALALLASLLTTSAQPAARPAATAQFAQGPVSTITPIPIPEIAQRAEQATTFLRATPAPEASEFRDAELELMETADWISKRHVTTTETLASSPSESALAGLADSWQAMRSRLVLLNGKLTRRATLAQQRVEQIETMRVTWLATQASAREATAHRPCWSRSTRRWLSSQALGRTPTRGGALSAPPTSFR